MFEGIDEFKSLPKETKDFYYKFFRGKSKHKDEPKEVRKATKRLKKFLRRVKGI